jgi:hypothetical protein
MRRARAVTLARMPKNQSPGVLLRLRQNTLVYQQFILTN